MKKLMALIAVLFCAAAQAANPAQFAYQGVLKDTNNAPITGTKSVELRLYSAASGGTALWGHTYNVQLDGNGLFNVEVSDGAGNPISGTRYGSLDDVLANVDVLYIGIKVQGSSGEIVPRQKLLPVPFASVAANAYRASGNFTVSGKLTAKSATFSSTLTASTLNVTQSASVGSLAATGNAVVSGNLAVGGKISGFGTVPVGGIIMWSGASSAIPAGWYLCDGNNGTPNLSGRFVIGAGGKYSVGKTGGQEAVTLTLEQIPRHRHEYQFKGADSAGGWDGDNIFYDKTDHYQNNSNSRYTEYAGGNSSGNTVAHDNMPPYYAICFIMRGQ